MIVQLLMEVTNNSLVAPSAALSAGAGLVALAAREYRAARREDVEGERKRRIEAESREKAAGETTATELEKLIRRVKSLEDKIDEMRNEHETELLEERGKNFALRKLLRENGIPIPEELGPK
jgi:hypothetical protein